MKIIRTDLLRVMLPLLAVLNNQSNKQIDSKRLNLIEACRHDARTLGYQDPIINDAIFAIVALHDERSVSLKAENYSKKTRSSLVCQLFQDQEAGVSFFTKLQKLRQQSELTCDVLIVYYLVLYLGFKGQYILKSPETLTQLSISLSKQINFYMVDRVCERKEHANLHYSQNSYSLKLPVIIGIASVSLTYIIYILWMVALATYSHEKLRQFSSTFIPYSVGVTT